MDEKLIIEEYLQGSTKVAIQRKHKITPRKLNELLADNGIVEKPRVRTTSHTSEIYAKLYQQGKTYEDIASQFGISQKHVYDCIRKHYPEVMRTRHGETKQLTTVTMTIKERNNLQKIADEFDCDYMTMLRLIAKGELKVSKRRSRKPSTTHHFPSGK